MLVCTLYNKNAALLFYFFWEAEKLPFLKALLITNKYKHEYRNKISTDKGFAICSNSFDTVAGI